MNLWPFSIVFWMRARPAGVSLSATVMHALICSLLGMLPVWCPCTVMC